jgi:hypothetical protein
MAISKALVLALSAPLVLLPAACSSMPTVVDVTTVSSDVNTIATGLAGALANIPGVPVAVTNALTDLAKEAAAINSASTQAAQQTVVEQVEADVNAIVAAAATIPALPPVVTVALSAAQVLLPVIEADVNLLVASAPVRAPMSADVAREILKADAAGASAS